MDDHKLDDMVEAIARRRPVLPLQCSVRHYAWGGFDFIPSLIGRANPHHEPFAELWIGAHPVAPSSVSAGGLTIPLDRLLTRTAQSLLGPEVAARFGGTLPYLLKVLDVGAMLSIQAHPNLQQAEDGFRRENAAGVSLDAAQRNFRDSNHKPEAAVALSEFWMLYGFQPLEAIAATFDHVPELRALAPDFGAEVIAAGSDRHAGRLLLRSLYQRVMTRPQAEIDRLVEPLLARVATPDAGRQYPKASPDFWAARAVDQFRRPDGHIDRGILSIYLLNLVRLAPGEGVFIPAGLLHSYLEGTAVEIMANSDNVLRGGLTSKHVDIEVLLSVLTFDSARPTVFGGERLSAAETRYGTPAAEFELSRLDIAPRQPYFSPTVWGADALLVLEGTAVLRVDTETIPIDRGAAVLVPNGRTYEIHATGTATIFRASVPHPL